MPFLRSLIIIVFFLVLAFLPESAFAATTPYRSAGWVGIPLSTSGTRYTNLMGCQETDGIYCERPLAPGGTNLYFSSFGTLSDFGIPLGSTPTAIRFRVTGKGTSVNHWIQVGQGRDKPVTQLCQNPNNFDSYKVPMTTADAIHNVSTVFTPFSTGGNNFDQCFSANNINTQNFTIALFFNGFNISAWNAFIDNFEIAFDYVLPPTPTPTNTPTPMPTMTPTPTPTPLPTPAPFLDLPWEYEKDFSDVALAMSAYFDHEYPLLSSELREPNETFRNIVSYRNFKSDYPYSSHDGYDYAKQANVRLGDTVLAAAAGWASYINTCGACGNAIYIDHGNGYQTRYFHLQIDGLITNTPNHPVLVDTRQAIGKVGATGNVIPKGDAGAHIHFMVVEDKNNDGNFADNIPDGVTDPFGWQSEEPDPWENYSFFYNGLQRTGNKSYYLWTKKIPNLREDLPSNGGIFYLGNDDVIFHYNPERPPLGLTMQYVPYAKASDTLVGLTPTLNIFTKDIFGNLFENFPEYITIKIDFSDVDLSGFDLGTTTFSIYSSDDQGNWLKEPTVIDWTNKKATTQVNHLTYFALMAERIDTIPPITIADLQGNKSQEDWYRSDVTVNLNAQDNEGGLGVDYTLYKIEGEDWQEYTTPITFTTEGQHSISFYSVDNDENIEEVKTVIITIDKTLPEAKIQFDTSLEDLKVKGIDDSSETIVTRTDISTNEEQIDVTDKAGNKLTIRDIERVHGPNAVMIIKSLEYNGNTIIPDTNKLSIRYQIDKESNVKTLEQKFEIKGVVKVLLSYDSKINKTEIVENGTETIVDGIRMLQLATDQGTLEYSY